MFLLHERIFLVLVLHKFFFFFFWNEYNEFMWTDCFRDSVACVCEPSTSIYNNNEKKITQRNYLKTG